MKSRNYRDKIRFVREIKLSAEELISALLNLSETETVCFLDSCAVSYLDSHLLIAGINPNECLQISDDNPFETLKILDEKITNSGLAGIFTISYDFGLKFENIESRIKEFFSFFEPDVFLALFDCLIIHDYAQNRTFLTGNEKKFNDIKKNLFKSQDSFCIKDFQRSKITSNFSRELYLTAVEKIKKYIKRGDTYQINLTQQFSAELPKNLSPQQIFWHLRKSHPAPFAAFIKREEDFVISISPERFFQIQRPKSKNQSPVISVSPIKGTRRRGETKKEDLRLKNELIKSEKDRAENVMIVDLLRNDLGIICKFGSVRVEKLCQLETHPTLFHLVSTINGELRENVGFSDILKAVFPCGSITGAPKIRTMQIIDELETVNRGLSMGAIGYSIPAFKFQIPNSTTIESQPSTFDLNVAIRTMVVRENKAIFNVGGGIVIDSIAEDEYEETLLKAKALIKSINGDFIG